MKKKRDIEAKQADVLRDIRARGHSNRVAEVVSVDVEARTVELAFSSEAEVRTWFGLEVLSHEPGAVRMGRLNNGAALLDNHNPDKQRGVVESASIDDDKRGRAVVRFGKSASADELFQDVSDRIKRHVSVGYMIHAIKLTEERGNIDVYTVTDWEPYEISIVSVPADTAVGVGRSAEATAVATEPVPVETHDERTLRDSPKLKDASGMTPEEIEQAARASGSETERARVRSLAAIADQFGSAVDGAEKMLRSALADGQTVEQFQSAMLTAMNARAAQPLSAQLAAGDIGLTARETRGYSLLRVIRALTDPTDRAAQKDAVFEFEASEAARAIRGGSSDRFVIPTDVLRHSVYPDAIRAMTSGTSGGTDTGGYGVATTQLTGSFVDILRNRATIMSLGTVLGGLVGNIDIPRQTAGANGAWVGEHQDAVETGVPLGQVSFSPKTVSAFTDISRKLSRQSSLDVEAMVRRDIAVALALTIDLAGYYGTGTDKQPLGLSLHDGVSAIGFVGVQPTFAELVEMETAIATDNADVNSMAYVANAGFRGHAKTTLKFAGVAGTIWEPGGQVNGYTTQITNQIATGDVIMGNFADLIVALWGGLEISVDPYSLSKSGGLRIVAFQDIDFGARRVESFAIGRQA